MTIRQPLNVKDLILTIKIALQNKYITDETLIIYSKDDEGNEYQWCIFSPTLMYSNTKIKYWDRLDASEVNKKLTKEDKTFTYLCIN